MKQSFDGACGHGFTKVPVSVRKKKAREARRTKNNRNHDVVCSNSAVQKVIWVLRKASWVRSVAISDERPYGASVGTVHATGGRIFSFFIVSSGPAKKDVRRKAHVPNQPNVPVVISHNRMPENAIERYLWRHLPAS